MSLKDRILCAKAALGVVGLGHAGLPLAVECARVGFDVHGIDVDADRVAHLNRGVSHVQDVGDAQLAEVIAQERFRAHGGYEIADRLDCVIICVPTPLRQTKDPDISFIVDATRNIARHLHPEMLIVLQSTTYPGTTEELLAAEFRQQGLEIGRDLFVAFSPERVDPGNAEWNTRNTPKIVGGITPVCTEMARLLFDQVVDRVIPVSSAEAAEMVKLLENTFRAVNIGLVNEVAIMCEKLGISVWEVIEAAATKPFGFMPFFPGPGLGGHCIPVDPLYLSWKLKMLNYNARFIELASEVNTQMPEYCVRRLMRVLNQSRKCVNGSRILVLGVSYKKDVGDVRESPALDMIRLLEHEGAQVDYADPLVPSVTLDGQERRSVELSAASVGSYDLVVLVTDHSGFDYQLIVEHAQLIFDTRHALDGPAKNVFQL